MDRIYTWYVRPVGGGGGAKYDQNNVDIIERIPKSNDTDEQLIDLKTKDMIHIIMDALCGHGY